MIPDITTSSSQPYYLSSSGADTAAIAYTDIEWPNNPFHKGEVALQQAAGVQEHVMSYAPKFVRNYLPDQHREFYPELPFLVVAARDGTDGAMWCTLLEKSISSDDDDGSSHRFISSPNDKTLNIRARPVPGDALENAFASHTKKEDMGILGIQLETKRRNRVNGRAVATDDGGLVFTVDQSFGNCPQYIKPRANWYRESTATTRTGQRSTPITNSEPKRYASHLTTEQIQWIETAETVFTASGYRGDGEDVRYGNDASHRGGAPGFVRVSTTSDNNTTNRQVISWTEYKGNNHFNTLGNLLMDPRMGVIIPNFATGGLLQVSGIGTFEMGKLEDGGRKVHLYVTAVNELPAGSFPIRWPTDENMPEEKVQVKVSKIVQESTNVKSFYLEPAVPFESLQRFRAGQHLPIELTLEDGELVKRTYSLSASPSAQGYYRISVKQEPNGKASTFLHNHVQVGDSFTVSQPAGDFVREHAEKKKQMTILLSSGIGITPILSMLHEIVSEQNSTSSDSDSSQKPSVVWMHGARNKQHHALRAEADSLLKQDASTIKNHVFYSQPNPTDDDRNHITGRISAKDVRRFVPDWQEAVYYICGPPAFLADLESGLEAMGVNPKNIHFETF